MYREVKARYNHVKSDEFYNVIEALLEEKILVRQKKSDFNVNEKWSRQVLFWQKYTNDKNKALLAQKIIEESSVLIIGGGGTGTWVSYYLAQLGIKELSIIDYDKVEMSNLNRQILFEESDCGKYKSEVIKEKILKVNKETKVNSIIKKIKNKDELKEIIEYFDIIPNVIISCADEPNVATVADIIGEYSTGKGIPHVVAGGYNRHSGVIGPTIIPGKTACWNCHRSHYKDDPKWLSARIVSNLKFKVPSLGILSSLIANIQTMEIIRILTNIEKPNFINKISEIKLSDLQLSSIHFYKDPDCVWCGGVR